MRQFSWTPYGGPACGKAQSALAFGTETRGWSSALPTIKTRSDSESQLGTAPCKLKTFSRSLPRFAASPLSGLISRELEGGGLNSIGDRFSSL
jgi:hypothetical protein